MNFHQFTQTFGSPRNGNLPKKINTHLPVLFVSENIKRNTISGIDIKIV